MTDTIATRYKVLKKLGEGAMGQVWLVEDTTNGNEVALKLISKALSGKEQSVLQFKQEFRLMTQLRHPNCCAVYDYGVTGQGAPFYSMEVVPGDGLDALLPLAAEPARDVLAQLLMALGYVHQMGFVHRDIKPENVRVTPDGQVKLMDYGLMGYAGGSDAPISGTLAYLSPEVVRRDTVDQRADLYSLGALLYELLTGQPPFPRPTPMEVLRAHVTAAPPRPSTLKAGLDPLLEKIALRLLAKDPAERYASAEAVLAALGIDRPTTPGTALLAPPLIGREAEVAQLVKLLSAMRTGGGSQRGLLVGPPGIGKTRLVKDFRARVQLEGLPFVSGSSREYGNLPYEPFRGLLRQLLPFCQTHVPALLEAHGPVLMAILPELGEVIARPEMQIAPEMDSLSKEKVRLQASVSELLGGLAAHQPLVLALEDWQWADPLSIDLLDYLARNLQARPILFLLTSRQEPPGSQSWLEGTTVVHVTQLPGTAISRLVTSMLGTTELAPGFVEQVARAASGNPFYAERFLEHLVEQEILVKSGGQWNTAIDLGGSGIPKDLQGVLLQKLSALTEDAIMLARAGAVYGRPLDLGIGKRLTGLSEDRLFDALGHLQRQQVLIPAGDGAYLFAHDLFKQVLLESFSPVERTRMDAHVAGVLEAQIGKQALREAPFELVTAIADHYILGCVPDKIVRYALEAGRRNANLFAAEEAERYLTTGLTLLKADNSPRWDKAKLQALRLLGDTCRLSGKVEAAKERYLEAIPLAQQVGAPVFMARMLTSLADCYLSLDDLQQALSCCHRSLELSLGGGDKGSATRCYLTSCVLQFMMGNLPGAIADTESALALARELEDQGSEGEALAFLGHLYVAFVPDKAAAGIKHLQDAVAILVLVGNKVGLQNAYNLLGAAQYKQGDFAEAKASFAENQKICFELGLKEEEAYARLNQALTDFALGLYAPGVAAAEEADRLATHLRAPVVHALAIAFQAAGMVHLGRLADAHARVAEALSLFKESPNKFLEARVLEHRMAILLAMGELGEGRATGERLRALLAETDNTEPEAHVAALMAEIRGREGDLAGADVEVERAIALASAGESKAVEVDALRVKSWLALRREGFAEARAIAGQALTLAYRLGAKPQIAELQGLLGELALAVGHDGAKAHFQAMSELATGMGTPVIEALALFGLAAASPYDADAAAKAARAKALLTTCLEGLDAAAVARFRSLVEWDRVLAGNYVDFSLKKAKKPMSGPLAPGLNLGGTGMW